MLLVFVLLRFIRIVLKYSDVSVETRTLRQLDIGIIAVSMVMLLMLAYGLFTGKLKLPTAWRNRK